MLVEGPPDAPTCCRSCADKAMKPPVALLVYAPEHAHRAVYYPVRRFSPEWQALAYALTRKSPRASSTCRRRSSSRASRRKLSNPRKRPRRQWAATRR